MHTDYSFLYQIGLPPLELIWKLGLELDEENTDTDIIAADVAAFSVAYGGRRIVEVIQTLLWIRGHLAIDNTELEIVSRLLRAFELGLANAYAYLGKDKGLFNRDRRF